MKAHPSHAHRWGGGPCPGSVALSCEYPDVTSDVAFEGKRLHALAAGVLKGGVEALTPDDAAMVDPYTRDVRHAVSVASARHRLDVEMPTEWALRPGLSGTPDAALFDIEAHTVTVWDYKTGWRTTEAVGNWQLLCYAVMVCPPKWTVDLRIAQPNGYHPDGCVRSWRLSWAELLVQAVTLADAYDAAMSAGASARPGEHCLYCPALSGCAAARDMSLRMVDYAQAGRCDLPDRETGRELGVLRQAAELLRLRADALEARAEARLRSGVRVPGLRLQTGRGTRKWKRNAADTASVLKLVTGEDYSEVRVGTPIQLAKRGVSATVLASLTDHHQGKTTVVIDDGSYARKAFGETQ